MTSFLKRLLGLESAGPASAPDAVSQGDAARHRVPDPGQGGSADVQAALPEDLMSFEPIPYDAAKKYARSEDPAIRIALASRTDVPAEILYFLSEDGHAAVRRAVALNGSTPALAHLVLVEDQDDRVRADLAFRIARLAPGLSPDEHDRARQAAYRVISRLAQDQMVRVRQILSEAIKDVIDAPSDVIRKLARDVEEVSAPVLEYSPVLQDEDLLDIIAASPSPVMLSAISRRQRLCADVADAIAETDDTIAIADLLRNTSAQIREETLDHLIETAPDRLEWHEPLVRRPGLHRQAAMRLAEFVADRWLQVLRDRRDLSPETLAEVKRVVHARLHDGEPLPAPEYRTAAPAQPGSPLPEILHRVDVSGWPHTRIEAFRQAVEMYRRGDLGGPVLLQAVKVGDLEFVAASLDVLNHLMPGAALEAIRMASCKAIAALVWHAALPPALSVQIQSRLARVAPADVLTEAADLPFGLTIAEMEWQIEMFAKRVENPHP